MIEHNKPCLNKNDSDILSQTLRRSDLAQGRIVESFENDLSKYLGRNSQTCVVSSGTSALFLALWALGIKSGDEVLAPSYVCSAILNAIFMLKAKPLLVDINPDDFNISYESTKKLITKKAKAIIIPHTYGVPADLSKFKKLGLPIVEDCAQALGATYKDQKVGTIGDVGVFSFYATKLMTTGHGGMISSRNKFFINKIKDYREFDLRKKYFPRFNFKMTDIQAALGLSQLKRLNSFIKKRENIAQRYTKVLLGFNLERQMNKSGGKRIYYRYVIISKNVLKLKQVLLKNAVKAIVPITSEELLHNYLRLPKKRFPHAENVSKNTLSLPIYPAMKNNEITKVCNILEKILKDYY